MKEIFNREIVNDMIASAIADYYDKQLKEQRKKTTSKLPKLPELDICHGCGLKKSKKQLKYYRDPHHLNAFSEEQVKGFCKTCIKEL